jgi:hypothetical protein
MKRIALGLLVIMIAPALVAGTALAYPTQSGACSNCHPHDAAVVVSATPLGCNGSNYNYQFTVSNTYEMPEGYGVFLGTTKVTSGYGNSVTLSLGQDKTYTLRGVSDSDLSANGGGKGGSNYVTVAAPHCADCVDLDRDGFFQNGGGCGAWDCNDADPAVNPNATEIKHDGVDQNCNGYDLTIDITKAVWSRGKRRVTVEASSAYGQNANLLVYLRDPSSGSWLYYGVMTWLPSSSTWQSIISISVNPGLVLVTGPEGQETATITAGK